MAAMSQAQMSKKTEEDVKNYFRKAGWSESAVNAEWNRIKGTHWVTSPERFSYSDQSQPPKPLDDIAFRNYLQTVATAAPSNINVEDGDGHDEESSVSGTSLAEYLKFQPMLAQQAYDLTQKFQPGYAELGRSLTGLERTQDISDAARLAPELQGIREGAETPEATQIRKLLLGQILGELGQGGTLTPEQELQTSEGIRSAQGARGLLGGQGAANRESVQRTLEGLRLLESRQQKAQSVLQQEAATSPDPFLTILGRPATSTATSAQQSAQGMGQITPGFFSQNAFMQQQLATQAQENARALKLQFLQFGTTNPTLIPAAGEALYGGGWDWKG